MARRRHSRSWLMWCRKRCCSVRSAVRARSRRCRRRPSKGTACRNRHWLYCLTKKSTVCELSNPIRFTPLIIGVAVTNEVKPSKAVIAKSVVLIIFVGAFCGHIVSCSFLVICSKRTHNRGTQASSEVVFCGRKVQVTRLF